MLSLSGTTVTPTFTTTVTVMTTVPAGNGKRLAPEVVSPAIPTYASLCRSVAAYASACNCIGVSAVTVSASTVISTTTITSTTTSSAPAGPTDFGIQLNYQSSSATYADKLYLAPGFKGGSRGAFIAQSSPIGAARLRFDSNKNLVLSDLSGCGDASVPCAGYIIKTQGSYYDTVDQYPPTDTLYPALQCSVDPTSRQISCQYDGFTAAFAVCNYGSQVLYLNIADNFQVLQSNLIDRGYGTCDLVTLTATS